MKAFWGGVIVMVIISVGAWAVLGTVGMSASDVYASDRSVRL